MAIGIFDLIIILITISFSLLGMGSGFIRLLINLLSLIASIYLSILLYPYSYDFLSPYFGSPLIATIVSGTASYIISLILISLAASKLNLLLSGVSKGFTDRVLGFLFGFFKGAIVSSVVFTFLLIFLSGSYLRSENLKEAFSVLNLEPEKRPSWLKKSICAPYLNELSKIILSAVPEKDLESLKLPKEGVERKAEEVMKKASETNKKNDSGEKASKDLSDTLKDLLGDKK